MSSRVPEEFPPLARAFAVLLLGGRHDDEEDEGEDEDGARSLARSVCVRVCVWSLPPPLLLH